MFAYLAIALWLVIAFRAGQTFDLVRHPDCLTVDLFGWRLTRWRDWRGDRHSAFHRN